MTAAADLHDRQGEAMTVLEAVLADGRTHAWTEVIDRLAAALTEGDRRDATYLAHLAARALDGEITWSGRPGSRRVGYLPVATAPVYGVPCPRCGAHEGRPCWRMVNFGQRPGHAIKKDGPHPERYTAALRADFDHEAEADLATGREPDDSQHLLDAALDAALDRDA